MGPGEDRETVYHERQRDRAQFLPFVVIGLIASALGIALGLIIDWFPTAAAVQANGNGAKDIDTLWDVLVIASVPVFVGVQMFVIYCVWRFRMRPGQEQQDGPPIHGNTRLEVIWTVIPAVLILGLCTYAYIVLEDIEEAPANPAQEMKVRVVGQQFTWTFEYGEGREAVRTSQLYLPKDESVQFLIQARDVLHSFWIPDMRMKIDAVPGITTDYRVTPNRLGSFEVVCAELCGIAHAYMRQTVRVVERPEFDRWLADQRRRGAGPAGGASGGAAGGADADAQAGTRDGADGKPIFEQNGCGACHTLADANTTGTSGPDLEKSLAGKDERYIRDGIVAPDKEIAEGFGPGIMPKTYGETLSQPEIDALVKYLDEVSK